MAKIPYTVHVTREEKIDIIWHQHIWFNDTLNIIFFLQNVGILFGRDLTALWKLMTSIYFPPLRGRYFSL